MRWSTKSILAYVTMFCLSLSLTWQPYRVGATVLLVVAIVMLFAVPFGLWWRAVVIGLISIGLLYAYLILECIDRYASTPNEAVEAPAFMNRWLPYVIQLGALWGGTTGALLFAKKRSTVNVRP